MIRVTWGSLIAGIVTFLALCYIGYDKYLAPKPPGPTYQERRQQAAEQRIAAGARVSSTVQISQHETLRVVHFPDPFVPGMPEMDRTCVLYTHAEWQTATFGCPPGGFGNDPGRP